MKADGVGLDPVSAELVAARGLTVHLRVTDGTEQHPQAACDPDRTFASLGQHWSGKLDEVTCPHCQASARAGCYICGDLDDHGGVRHSEAAGDNRVRGGIIYTGRNATDVRAFIEADDQQRGGETWFVTRNQAAPTGGQAWRYIKGDAKWPDTVAAAVYDPAYGDWQPVERGDIIRRDGRLDHRYWTVEKP